MPPATATEPAAAPAHKVKIEDVGPARKRLTITVPADAVDDKLQTSLGTLAHETALPGFRKGRAPQKLLERRFGSNVRAETKNQLVAAAYAAAIEEHKLKPIGEPEPGEDMKDLELQAGKPLTFSLEVEVLPDFEIPDFKNIEVKKPMLQITPKHVEEELKRQQLSAGTPNKVESDFEDGDRLGGYATVTRNDETEPFFRQDDVLILMPGKDEGGRGQFLGLMIDGLYGLLKNKNVGDTIQIEAVGPEAHEREDIRGAKLHMTFEIRVAERVTPSPAAEVANRYGLPSEDILREQIKMALEFRRDDEQASAMREQVIEQLSAMVDFEMPEKLSAAQAARNLELYRLELLSRGMNVEEIEEKLAEARGEAESSTRERLKRFFLLHRLGDQFKIEVSEQEVNGRIAAMAGQRNVRPDRLRNELAQAGRLGEVARLIRDQKAADRVVTQVKQTEVTAEEWNRIYREKQTAAAGDKSAEKPAKKTTSRKAAAAEKDEKESKPTKPAPKSKAASEEAPAKKKTTKKK